MSIATQFGADLSSAIQLCQRCQLSQNCRPVPFSQNAETPSVVFVAAQADREAEIFGEPLSGRHGELLRKLASQAGISKWHLTYLVKCAGRSTAAIREACATWLDCEFATFRPPTVVSLGLEPALHLLKLPKKTKLVDVVGSIHNQNSFRVGVWYASQRMLTSGKKMDGQFVEFLQKLVAGSGLHD